jgi:hypothetical protein
MSIVQQVAPAPQRYGGQVTLSNGLAVGGFVLAALGALISLVPIVNVLGDFLAFLGLIFGVIGLIKARGRRPGAGLSIATVILAVAAFVISAVVNVAAVAVLYAPVKDMAVAQNVCGHWQDRALRQRC